MLTAKSASAEVTFDGHMLVIRRRMAAGNSSKSIPIESITAVQWKSPGLVNGFLEFTLPGGQEHQGRKASLENENGLVVRLGNTKPFEMIRDAVNDAIRARHTNQQTTAAPPDAMDQLRKLADLHRAGIVSNAEFEAKKADILRRA